MIDMATYELRAFDSSGNRADRVTTTATGPGALGTVQNLFFLPVVGEYTFAAVTPETASYEVVRAIQDDTAPTISGVAVDGFTVTITEGTYTGTTPITITGTLTLDGVDVTADMVGNEYTIPAGSVGKVLEWKERASNIDGVSRQQTTSLTGTGAFSPAALFAFGEQGAWYDPSDLTTLYQDSAGTTTVRSDGDPVGRMEDKSGNGNHATQATSAARPVYRTDGTLHWLEFDGVDDALGGSGPIMAGTDPVQILVAGSTTTTSENSGFFAVNPTSTIFGKQRSVGLQNGSTLKVDAREHDARVSTDMSADSVFEGRFDASASSEVKAAVNGGAFNTSTGSLTSPTGDFVIGKGLAGDEIAGKIYGLIVRAKHLSAAERSDTVSYLAGTSGVTL